LLKCRKNNFTFEEKVKKTKTAIFFPPRIWKIGDTDEKLGFFDVAKTWISSFRAPCLQRHLVLLNRTNSFVPLFNSYRYTVLYWYDFGTQGTDLCGHHVALSVKNFL
jgi:hypothetical protein